MAETRDEINRDKYDILIANAVYPDVKGIFETQAQSPDSLKDTSFVVLDTNVLLLPYRTGRESLQRIGETYKQLVDMGRLVIPGQVAREFAKNRPARLAELFQQIIRKANVPNLQKGKYPLLESLDEYRELIRLEKEIDKRLEEYRKTINGVAEQIRDWTWNDPVSLLYAELFTENVLFDPAFTREEIIDDLNHRQLHNIPPGFKDASKEDKGVGDILIWHTILELGRQHKKSILFVTGDEKADWYHQSEKQALYPRFELVDEYRRTSQGQVFQIISFSRFLDLYGVSANVVQEVRTQEQLSIQRSAKHAQEGYIVERAVYNWLKSRYPDAQIILRSRMSGHDYGVESDLEVIDEESGHVAVLVKYFRRLAGGQPRIHWIADKFAQQSFIKVHNKLMLVLVASDFEDAAMLKRSAETLAIKIPELEVVVGYITPDLEFLELSEAV